MTFGDQLLLESIRKNFVLMDLKLILVFSIFGTYSEYLDHCFQSQYIEKSWSSLRKLFKWLSFQRTFFCWGFENPKIENHGLFSFVEYKWEKSLSFWCFLIKKIFFLIEIRKLQKWQFTSLFNTLLCVVEKTVELWVYRMLLSITFVAKG